MTPGRRFLGLDVLFGLLLWLGTGFNSLLGLPRPLAGAFVGLASSSLSGSALTAALAFLAVAFLGAGFSSSVSSSLT